MRPPGSARPRPRADAENGARLVEDILAQVAAHVEAQAGPDSLIEPLLVDARRIARKAGVSRSHWLKLHASGRVPAPIRLGGRVLWRPEEVAEWTRAGCPSRDRWEAMREGKR